jgi:hypothetical protein
MAGWRREALLQSSRALGAERHALQELLTASGGPDGTSASTIGSPG